MLGITDFYLILSSLGYKFDLYNVESDDGYVLVEIKGLFNKWERIGPLQLNIIQNILSPNYKIRLVRKVYKFTIWEQVIIGGKLI